MTDNKRPDLALAVADKVELRLLDLDTGETRRYRTTIMDIEPDHFTVGMPVDKGVPVALRDGTVLVVSLWKDFADHLFQSRVLGRLGGRVPQLTLALPDPASVRRTPRRDYFRVDTKIQTRVRLTEDGELARVPAVMLDLSGGGCRLQVARQFRLDTPLTLDLELPFPNDSSGMDRSKPLRDVPGIIRGCFAPANAHSSSRARSSIHMLGVEFQQLDTPVRSAIMRYVAFRQREALSQLQEGGKDESKVSTEEMVEIQQALEELESDLDQAVTEPEDAAPPEPESAARPEAADGDTRPASETSSADDLFADATAEPDQLAEPVTPTTLEPLGVVSGKTILLVEDEEEIRAVLAAALRLDGHRIVGAANGEEALDRIAQSVPDLVMTDLMMPRMNGWRLLRALQDRGLDIPAIIITGYMNQEGQDVLTSRDVSGFLVKPVDLQDMTAMVSSVFASPKSRATRVLAVDDDEEARLLVSACLSKAGFVVETVAGGREALVRAGPFRPDLVLLDIMMPGIDGFETAQRFRADPALATIPIVMLTARSSPEYVRKAVALKISGYMVKPFEPYLLVERIRKVLRLPDPA
jgi:CheY-like chemotaxis protein